MDIIILYFLIVLFIIAFIEFICKFFWVKQYYSFGIKLYERKLSVHYENISELFGRLKDGMSNTGLLNICFHMSNDYDYILFRERLINYYKMRSFLHGKIFQENDQFRIIGFISITTLLFLALFLLMIFGIIIICAINRNNNIVFAVIMAIPIIIAITFIFIDYAITKDYLDKI